MPGADNRIVAVELDERTVIWRNADVEQERRVAIFDLLEGNMFRPIEVEGDGPWRLVLRVEDGRLAMDMTSDGQAEPAGSILLGLAPFRRVVREYFAICDSYYKAIRNASPSAIETIDMARRGIHHHPRRARFVRQWRRAVAEQRAGAVGCASVPGLPPQRQRQLRSHQRLVLRRP